jgi:hypothetical protein
MDPAALDALKVAKEVASEWERIVQPGKFDEYDMDAKG